MFVKGFLKFSLTFPDLLQFVQKFKFARCHPPRILNFSHSLLFLSTISNTLLIASLLHGSENITLSYLSNEKNLEKLKENVLSFCKNIIACDDINENLINELLNSNSPKKWFRAYFNHGLINYIYGQKRLLPCDMAFDTFFIDPYGDVMPCNGTKNKEKRRLPKKVGVII